MTTRTLVRAAAEAMFECAHPEGHVFMDWKHRYNDHGWTLNSYICSWCGQRLDIGYLTRLPPSE